VSVRWQIILPFAAVVILTSAVGAYALTGLYAGSAESRFVGHLVEGSRVAAESLVRRERAHLETARAIAFTSGVPEALRARPETLDALVRPLAANTTIERVELLDAAGVLKFGLVRPAASGAPYAPVTAGTPALEGIERVLAGTSDEKGDKFIELAEVDGEAWIVTVAPVRAGEQLVGAVLVSSRLATALLAAHREALADVTAFDRDGRILATTSFARAEDPLAGAAAPTGEMTTVALGERTYRELHSDLVLRGEPVGSLAVALPTDFLGETTEDARIQLSLLLFGAIAVTLMVGARVARRLTNALDQLVRTSRTVTGGNLTARVGLQRRDEIGELSDAFDRMTRALQDQHLGAIASLVSAIDARDPYTRGHSLRVGHLASLLGQCLGLNTEQQLHLQVGGYLHDIGKIGVRDEVLLKPGALTEEERRQIQVHPVVGNDILAAVGLAPEVVEGVYLHHERLDGSGYPLGLAGDAVPLTPRIIMVADYYDALVTDRPYRRGGTREEALAIIGAEVSYGRLDVSVVQALAEVSTSWDAYWRSDPQMRGFTLDQVPVDPDIFRRAA